MEFIKMHGAGNDFILFDGTKEKIIDYERLAKDVCERHFGIGADGIMVAENSEDYDIKMVYYNSDGSLGEMCGNGIRCFSKFVYEKGLIKKNEIEVETLAGVKKVWLEVKNHEVQWVKVNMGKAIFSPKDIPILCDGENALEKSLHIDDKTIIFSTVLVGVPHTIIFVEDIKKIDINRLGEKIEKHSIFPKKTNVNFVEVKDKDFIHVYTWERGAGRTLACGTGCCSSVVVGHALGKLNKKVKVQAEGGLIEVELNDNLDIFMKGEAQKICTGNFEK
ncbi:diaminopimelate epimerase [Inediibacterium massiliense]|uniref:diaminopimelate epimerase n=1 Tax=Inediibacterium massiliense TaxID=1658111 RepID=UPI0006B55AAF|nr:diaminopimelate epimerase [Inediibacterium massiliense]